MYRLLFIVLAMFVYMTNQNLFVLPGTSINDPIYACLLALILSPWIERQFD